MIKTETDSRSKLRFELEGKDGNARAGRLNLRGQEIRTPVFMPVGTNATVKAMTVDELKRIGYRLILGNTYHLHLRPGDGVIHQLGGLHRFMNWNRALLTDSGGFQVFSLGHFNRISEEGVFFKSHLDGSQMALTPESAIVIQENLGSDIMMVLDECLPIPVDRRYAEESIARTSRWAARSFAARNTENSLFGIVQGADFDDLRVQSAAMLMEIDFDGFAIGGLSVGEEKSAMDRIVAVTAPLLPENKPRYLMGVGDPLDILNAIESGIDMFDCVLPTRNARNGGLFTFNGPLSIKQSRYRDDSRPIDKNCRCDVCCNYSRAYLRHLFKADEILSSRLNSYHNLWFFSQLMKNARDAILAGTYPVFKRGFLDRYST